MKNYLFAQSGGPTSAINSSLAGLYREASRHGCKIYGSLYGITGLLEDNLSELNFSEKELGLLTRTPAAYLRSARYSLPLDLNDPIYNTILEQVKKYEIGYICLIGGNDSMDTVDKLSAYFAHIGYDCNVIGVPKTIDNDLIITDHTPGYGSAIKYIATTIEELKLDTTVYAKGRVTVVEIMGRDAGWLTAGAKLASLNGLGADLIYLPEHPFDIDEFIKDVERVYKKKQKVLIAVSEGIKDEKGSYISELWCYDAMNDVFGHKQLGGVSAVLSDIIHRDLDLPVRRIELSLMQRCAGHILSATDISEGERCGKFAADKVRSISGKAVVMKRELLDYSVIYDLVDVHEIANKVKYFPEEWIINGNDISDDYIRYALPLIQGDVNFSSLNGLPLYFKFKK